MADNVVEFSIKAIDDFSATLGNLNNGLGIVQKAFIAVAAAYPVAKVMEMAKASLENADAMSKAAQKAQVSTEQFSAMAWAAKLSDVSTEGLSKSYKQLGLALSEGSASIAGQQLKQLGIETKDPTEAMLKLADVFNDSANTVEKTAVAVNIFKKTGSEMIPFLNQGSEAIRKMMQDAKDLGQVISTDFGASAEQVNDNLDTMASLMSGTMNQAMANLSPILEGLTEQFIQMNKEENTVANAGVFLATALKLVVSVGLVVIDTFQAIGHTLGGVGAAIAAAAHGDFAGAANIIKETYSDVKTEVGKDMKQLSDMWDDSVQSQAAADFRARTERQKHAKEMSALNSKMYSDQDSLKKAIEDQIASLKSQTEHFGESAEMMKFYELQTKAATLGLTAQEAAQFKVMKALIETKEKQDEYSKALEYMKGINPYNKMLKDMDDLEKVERAIGGATAETNAKRKEIQLAYDQARISSNAYMNNEMTLSAKMKDMYKVNAQAVGNYTHQIATGMLSTWQTAQKGMGDAVAASLIDGENLGKALESVAKNALKTVISMLIQMGIQRMILAAIDTGATQTESAMKKGAALGDVYLNSFASAAAIPMIGWAMAPGVASANTAIAAAITPGVIATGAALGAIAHGGMDYVPNESTYLLQKGERVLSPNQNSDLTKFMKEGNGGGTTIQSLTIHVLENATNADAFAKMSPIELRNKLGKPIIDALNEMYKMGMKPKSQTSTVR